MQAAVRVLYCERIVGPVARHAGESGAVAEHHRDRLITGHASSIRIQDVLAKLRQGARGASVGEIRSQLPAPAAYAVALAAPGFPPERRLAGCRIARHD